MIEAFLLGIFSGTACVSTCGSILFPYMISKQFSVKQSWRITLFFLLSRYIFYLIVGFLLAYLGQNFISNSGIQHLITGIAYIILAYTLIKKVIFKSSCTCKENKQLSLLDKNRFAIYFIPIIIGFTSGLGFCPTLLFAFTQKMQYANNLDILSYYTLFFIGTTIYFLPIPFLSLVKKNENVKKIGTIATALIAAFLVYKSVILIIGGANYAFN